MNVAKAALVAAGFACTAGCATPTENRRARLTCDLGDGVVMQLVGLPEGNFWMGSKHTPDESVAWFRGTGETFGPEFYKDEHPRHRVQVPPFYMGRHEVTVAQFRRFVEETGYVTDAEAGTPAPEKRDMQQGARGGYTVDGDGDWILDRDITWRKPGFSQTEEHPVVVISWNDAQAFCRWLSVKSGRRVRLPSEAEWEYACRGATDTLFWWGDHPDLTGKVANLADEKAKQRYAKWAPMGFLNMDDSNLYAAPIGSYAANPFGLHDMLGNVFEWCEDVYHPTYDGAPPDGTAWTEPSESGHRIFRGGGWGNGPRGSRCAARAAHSASFRGSDLGFRVVVDVRQRKPAATTEYPMKPVFGGAGWCMWRPTGCRTCQSHAQESTR